MILKMLKLAMVKKRLNTTELKGQYTRSNQIKHMRLRKEYCTIFEDKGVNAALVSSEPLLSLFHRASARPARVVGPDGSLFPRLPRINARRTARGCCYVLDPPRFMNSGIS